MHACGGGSPRSFCSGERYEPDPHLVDGEGSHGVKEVDYGSAGGWRSFFEVDFRVYDRQLGYFAASRLGRVGA
jgi:hypothetical protein